MLRNGIDDIWEHAFFKNSNITEKRIGLKDIVPPCKPQDIESGQQDSYFMDLKDLVIGTFEDDNLPPFSGDKDLFSGY